MDIPKISIIVPVYGVEQYLKRCVDSILAQTFKDFEVILVDDGSKDHSPAMCDEYARIEKRVRVIHKENGGLTSAWKAGVQAASAEYVGFVDGDDWIDEDMYERLYENAVKYDSDLAICGLTYDYEDDSREKTYETSRLEKEVYDTEEIVSELFPVLINNGTFFGRTVQAARVTKLYRKSLVLANIKYCDDRVSIGEDLQLTFPCICDAKRISFIPEFYPYHYWINESSLTGKHDPKYLEKITFTKRRLQWISLKKDVYDFSHQIENDFFILSMMAIRSEIVKRKDASPKEVIKGIRAICEDPYVVRARRRRFFRKLPLSVNLYQIFIELHLYPVCYVLGKMFLK